MDYIPVPISRTRPMMSQAVIKINDQTENEELDSTLQADDLSREEITVLNSRPEDTSSNMPSQVKRSSATQFSNDLNYLNKIKIAPPNVHFKFGNVKVISLHSFVLLARSWK